MVYNNFMNDTPLPPVEPAPESVPQQPALDFPVEDSPAGTQPVRLSASRRRRARRQIVPREAGARAEFLELLAHAVTPGLSFYLLTALCGVLVAAAVLLDSPALFVLAALLAPFMGPVVGLSLASVLGSFSFFLRSLIGVLVGGALVFALGVAGGVLSYQFPALRFSQAIFHTQFTWSDMIVLLLGASLTAYLLIHSKSKPLAPSVALAYEIYLPLGVAGFGLANPQAGLFPDGLLFFASNLAVTVLIGILVMALLGLRPLTVAGYTVGSSIFLVVLAAVLAFAGIGQVILSSALNQPLIIAPSETPPPATATLPATAVLPTPSPQPVFTETPVPPTVTLTRAATSTLIPTATQTATLAPSPTPVWGLVNAGDANGVIIRPEPGSFEMVTSLLNGNLVQILPEVVNRGGVIWLHVRTVDGKEGWVQSILIATATPRPR